MQGTERLKHCQVFVFDLDGTLYADLHQFEVYAEALSCFLSPTAADGFKADVRAVGTGRCPLRYGMKYDLAKDLLVDDGGQAYSWDGTTLTVSPSPKLVAVEDPWWMYHALAAHHGASEADCQNAFLKTRDYMASQAFEMTPLAGLREAILALRAVGRKAVVATNSPEPASRAILAKLGLSDVFDDHAFQANKPHRIEQLFARWQDQFDVPYTQMVSIGDHYVNEIEPAVKLGMVTIHISRFVSVQRPGVTFFVEEPGQLGCLLQQALGG